MSPDDTPRSATYVHTWREGPDRPAADAPSLSEGVALLRGRQFARAHGRMVVVWRRRADGNPLGWEPTGYYDAEGSFHSTPVVYSGPGALPREQQRSER